MGQFKEEVKGAANQAAGNTRQVVGEALGDTEMQQRGLDQERKGERQDAEGDVEGALGNDI
jgi:uncharacterized protein YjbJ (UPF0337 family)